MALPAPFVTAPSPIFLSILAELAAGYAWHIVEELRPRKQLVCEQDNYKGPDTNRVKGGTRPGGAVSSQSARGKYWYTWQKSL